MVWVLVGFAVVGGSMMAFVESMEIEVLIFMIITSIVVLILVGIVMLGLYAAMHLGYVGFIISAAKFAGQPVGMPNCVSSYDFMPTQESIWYVPMMIVLGILALAYSVILLAVVAGMLFTGPIGIFISLIGFIRAAMTGKIRIFRAGLYLTLWTPISILLYMLLVHISIVTHTPPWSC